MESNFKIYITNKKDLDSVLFNNKIHQALYSIVYNKFVTDDSIICTVILSEKYMFSLKGIKQNVLFYEFAQV